MFSNGIAIVFGWEIKMGERAVSKSWHELIGATYYTILLITLHCSASFSDVAQSTRAKNLGSK